MSNSIKAEDIDIVMSNCEPEHQFITKKGDTIKNITELAQKIKQMDEETYIHHANEQRNDFSNWIKDVLKDEELANEIKRSKNKQETANRIDDKIKRLNKIKEHLKKIEEQEKTEFKNTKETVTNEKRGMHDYIYGIIIGTITGLLLGMLL
jgi:ElaB/YqjD/DUF883 family membrane-anchored ribosome-binding protein